MESLPPELVAAIFQQLHFSVGPAALVASLRCSRRLHDIAEPLLYRDISLTNVQLTPFISCARSRSAPPNSGVGAVGALVRSLTITIDAVPPAPDPATREGPFAYREDEEQIEREGSAESKALWGQLRDMAALIVGGSGGGMTNLVSFSLRVSDRTSGAKGFWIPRPLIALLVASLPPTCVNIEVDTQGHDFAAPGAAGAGNESDSSSGYTAGHHLCDTFRKVLPRLHHFRLRVKVLCPAVFVAGYRGDLAPVGEDADDSGEGGGFAGLTAVAAPALKTVVINCVMQHPGYGGPGRLCGTLAPENRTNFYWGLPALQEARIPLARCLRWLYTLRSTAAQSTANVSGQRASSWDDGSGDSGHTNSGACFPAVQRLWLLDMQLHYDMGRGARVYAALNRRDIAAHRTVTMPIENVWGSERDTYMLRMAPSGEVVSSLPVLQALAEGETWIETLGGARLPAAAATTAAAFGARGSSHGVVHARRPLPLESAESYRARFPRRGYELWRNEAITGQRLLEAVERAGLTDSSPVREKTPHGWKRRHGCLVPM